MSSGQYVLMLTTTPGLVYSDPGCAASAPPTVASKRERGVGLVAYSSLTLGTSADINA